ncbi:pyridoxal-phosphate dependent enzyme, partial [Pseudomonas aeruginosa]|uniref:pyridoxal-phosphate dependent enzyme n=1 Tax=Pseudomonas aeruginosa TaxID=287 RepID=UPI001F0A3C46
ARGVIAASAGNHAQGLALAAKRQGIRAVIVMPKTTPEIKVQAAECTAVFRNGPETPKVRKGVIQPGQNSNFTAQFGRDIIKL